ncbi:unnamed protein product [Albugo candida]|uniref:Secreted protein n=1 Tax=Albugo candida TaxID=65357 RepID=A0A024GVU9_9STRA|nr:unnamed protein product [Albugo candida]|eukprot:CCI50578.1 unnamed protein product [Albugo candida]
MRLPAVASSIVFALCSPFTFPKVFCGGWPYNLSQLAVLRTYKFAARLYTLQQTQDLEMKSGSAVLRASLMHRKKSHWKDRTPADALPFDLYYLYAISRTSHLYRHLLFSKLRYRIERLVVVLSYVRATVSSSIIKQHFFSNDPSPACIINYKNN